LIVSEGRVLLFIPNTFLLQDNAMIGSRAILFLLYILVLSGCQTIPKSNDASGVEHRYVPREDLVRISEYFTRREHPGNRIYLRSDPETREGYYWIVAIPEKMRNAVGRTVLEVQVPGDPATRTYDFPVPPSGGSTVWAGLTGADWPSPKARPVAWRFSLLDEDGKILFERESFLWKPVRFKASG